MESKIFTKKDYEDMGSPSQLVIPQGYTEIGDRAFCESKSLGSISIPDSVKIIGQYAFYVASLEIIIIPNAIVEIKDSAFYGNKLSEFIVDDDNAYFKSIDGVLFSKDETKLIYYPGAKKDETYSTPSNAKEILSGAISYCTNLKQLILSEGLKSIGLHAISHCDILHNISLPNSLIEISSSNMQDCASLSTIFIPKNIQCMGDYLFARSKSLSSIEVHRENNYFSSQEGVLFDKLGKILILYPASKDPDYIVPQNVTIIAKKSFCNGNQTLKSIIFPDSLEIIEEGAFQSCNLLTSIELPLKLKRIAANAFKYCDRLNITVDDRSNNFSFDNGVLFDKDKRVLICYFNNDKQSHYIVPEGVNIIGKRAFYNSNIDTIILPSSLIALDEESLYGGIKAVGIRSLTPPHIHRYIGVDSRTILSVPLGSKELYCNSEWGYQFRRIEEKDL